MQRGATTFEDVIAAVKQQITNYCPASLPAPTDVFATVANDEEVLLAPPPHDRFVIVRPSDFSVDQGIVAGAGAGVFVDGLPTTTTGLVPLNWHLEVSLFVRLLLDQQGRDDSYLLDPRLGLLQLFRRLMGSLQLFDPADVKTTLGLLQEPMRLVRGSLRPRRPRADWGKLESVWEVKFPCEFPTAEQVVG